MIDKARAVSRDADARDVVLLGLLHTWDAASELSTCHLQPDDTLLVVPPPEKSAGATTKQMFRRAT